MSDVLERVAACSAERRACSFASYGGVVRE
jgi:hypothetical protein